MKKLNDPEAIKNWQLAKKHFEEYMDWNLRAAKSDIYDRSDISKEVKTILISLLNCRPEEETVPRTAVPMAAWRQN